MFSKAYKKLLEKNLSYLPYPILFNLPFKTAISDISKVLFMSTLMIFSCKQGIVYEDQLITLKIWTRGGVLVPRVVFLSESNLYVRKIIENSGKISNSQVNVHDQIQSQHLSLTCFDIRISQPLIGLFFSQAAINSDDL